MAEIVCTSCSQGFESTAGEEEEVACPACGHAQSVSAAREAAEQGEGSSGDTESGDEPPASSDQDPFDGIEEEMVFDMEDDEGSLAAETADFSAVLPSENDEESSEEQPAPEEEAQPAPEEEAQPAPEEEQEDTRWRFRSGSGLVLFFPTYEVATKWIIKQNSAEISIAYGSGEFRLYSTFEAQLRTTGDPMAAILSAPSAAEPVDAAAVEASAEDSQEDQASPGVFDPVAEVSPPSGKPRGGDSESPRATTMTSDFQFRTGKDVNVWPGRALFLVLGILLGAGGVYYAAWYGLLPGILY